MRITIFSIILFGYGLTLIFRKSEKDHNPKSKNYNSDGSVSKSEFVKQINEFSDWQFTFKFLYNYAIIFRINLNR